MRVSLTLNHIEYRIDNIFFLKQNGNIQTLHIPDFRVGGDIFRVIGAATDFTFCQKFQNW